MAVRSSFRGDKSIALALETEAQQLGERLTSYYM